MAFNDIRCTAYLAKSICDGVVNKYGVGYPAMLDGNMGVNISLPGGDTIVAHEYVEYINGLSFQDMISAEFTVRETIIIPHAGTLDKGDIVKAYPHGDIAIAAYAGRLRLLSLKSLTGTPGIPYRPEVSTKDLYTYIADTTGVDRNSVKTFLFKTLLSNPKKDIPIFEIVRELKLSYQEVSHMIQSFNEWTGAYES